MNIIKKLSIQDHRTIRQLLRLFHQVDKETIRFKRMTGIRCPDNCGACCMRPDVETTALEMLPLAVELWAQNTADYWLEKIERSLYPGLCVFFEADPVTSGNGRCRIYALRPLICRLFGFFTVKNKHDEYVYGSCKIIRAKYPQSYQKTQQMLKDGFHPSNMTDFTVQVLCIGSDLGRKMHPINIAASIALEKVWFTLR
ncbi:MAG: YkgJ family cysteine cluster protein [Candidatus Omnitrophica bacterium]|nr:YkgJ family cysteine cluster protein [Candidatus Omnitrophota bacterium]